MKVEQIPPPRTAGNWGRRNRVRHGGAPARVFPKTSPRTAFFRWRHRHKSDNLLQYRLSRR